MKSMLGWMGRTFARFVGLSVVILAAWLIMVNLAEGSYPASTMAIIVTFGVVGVAGGLAYLFSFDGPAPFRRRWVRVLGWSGMLFSAFLPSALTLMLVPMVLLVSPTLFMTSSRGTPAEAAVTSE